MEALSTTEVGTSSIVLCESLRYNVVLCCVSCSDDDADAFASIALWAQSLCWPYRCSHNNGNAFSSHVLKRPDASKHFCSTDMNRGKDRQTDGRTNQLSTYLQISSSPSCCLDFIVQIFLCFSLFHGNWADIRDER